MKYRAIVFDVDGTLLDTRVNIGVIQRAYHRLYPERDILPYAHFVKCYSMTGAMTGAYLSIFERDSARFIELLEDEHKYISDKIVLFDGIEALVMHLTHHGYALGINTSRDRNHLIQGMTELPSPIWDTFGCVVTQDEIAHSKPAPDSLLYFMEQTNLSPSEVLFVGDSNNDRLCAERAHCDFALAAWGSDPHEKINAMYSPQTPLELMAILAQ